ncbi:MAG: hypothetical protein ABSG79_14390 [Bryobacteraceae bacterium]
MFPSSVSRNRLVLRLGGAGGGQGSDGHVDLRHRAGLEGGGQGIQLLAEDFAAQARFEFAELAWRRTPLFPY